MSTRGCCAHCLHPCCHASRCKAQLYGLQAREVAAARKQAAALSGKTAEVEAALQAQLTAAQEAAAADKAVAAAEQDTLRRVVELQVCSCQHSPSPSRCALLQGTCTSCARVQSSLLPECFRGYLQSNLPECWTTTCRGGSSGTSRHYHRPCCNSAPASSCSWCPA